MIKFPLKPIIETLSWNFVYASVGDGVENAEQIETLKVQVAWCALLCSARVWGKNLNLFVGMLSERQNVPFRHYRIINSIKERLSDKMPFEYALMWHNPQLESSRNWKRASLEHFHVIIWFVSVLDEILTLSSSRSVLFASLSFSGFYYDFYYGRYLLLRAVNTFHKWSLSSPPGLVQSLSTQLMMFMRASCLFFHVQHAKSGEMESSS